MHRVLVCLQAARGAATASCPRLACAACPPPWLPAPNAARSAGIPSSSVAR